MSVNQKPKDFGGGDQITLDLCLSPTISGTIYTAVKGGSRDMNIKK